MRDDQRGRLLRKELRSRLPANKDDLAAVESLVAMGYPAVAPLVYDLLRWIQVESWPVAGPICTFLRDIGPPLAPHVHRILISSDDPWKAVVLSKLVRDWPKEEIVRLSPALYTVATDGQSWGADLLALELLARHRIGDPDWIAGWLAFKRDHHQARLAEIEAIQAIVEEGAA